MEHFKRGVELQFFCQAACLFYRVERLFPDFGIVVCISCFSEIPNYVIEMMD